MNTTRSLKFGKKVTVITHVVCIERETFLEDLIIQAFYSRSRYHSISTLESSTLAATRSCLFHDLSISGHQGITDCFLFILSFVEFHHTHGIAKGVMHFLFLMKQLINNSEVRTKPFIVGLIHQVIDNGALLLTIAVDTTITLLQSNQTPRYVIVEHDVAIVMKVDTLWTTITGDEDANLTILFGEVTYHLFLFGIRKWTVKAYHLFFVELKLTHDTLLQILHGSNTLGKDDNTFFGILIPKFG